MADAGTQDIIALLDKIIARYKPGGEFGKPEEALLRRGKERSLAGTAQRLVSAGLAGTTAGAGAGRLWEEEVGMPTRLRLEDVRSQRLTEAMGAKAGYLEREAAATAAEKQAALDRALEYYKARGPSMAEQGLNVFGEPLGTFGLPSMIKEHYAKQTGAGGGGAGGGYGGDFGGVGTSYSGGGGTGVSGGVYYGPEAGGGATFGDVYDPTVGQAILGGPQAGQFVTSGGGISGGTMGGYAGESPSGTVGGVSGGAAPSAGDGEIRKLMYKVPGGGYTSNPDSHPGAKPSHYAVGVMVGGKWNPIRQEPL